MLLLLGAFYTWVTRDDVIAAAQPIRSVTVGYLHTEFATDSFVQHGRIFIRFWDEDDDFEYNGHPYRFEPEYTDEELLEKRMQKQREKQLSREQTAACPQIDANW